MNFQGRRRSRRARVLTAWMAACLAGACVSLPYQPEQCDEADPMPLREDERQIEIGRPHKWVDGFGHYFFSLPSKLVLLDWRVNNHDVGERTELAIADYLATNGLCNVKVRLNQYAVGNEWSRLFRNKGVAAGWRYTFGILTVSIYTIFPERLFAGFPFIGGGDHYNAFTNTISLYSDVPAFALHEGGHAKDFAAKGNRHWKGGYAALRVLPLVPLWQEGVASSDAVSLLRSDGAANKERDAHPLLWAAYGTYVAGEVGRWTPLVPGAGLVAAWTGRVLGWARARFVPDPVVPGEPGEDPIYLGPGPLPYLADGDRAAVPSPALSP